MEILTLLVFILSSYGFSNMVVYSTGPFGVFEWWRNISEKIHPKFGELFNCMMCFPMWVGMFLSVINIFVIPHGTFIFTPMNALLLPSYYLSNSSEFWLVTIAVILMDGAIASGTSWILHNVEEYFENN